MESVVGNNDCFSLFFKYVLVVLLIPHSNASTEHDIQRKYFLWLIKTSQRAAP